MALIFYQNIWRRHSISSPKGREIKKCRIYGLNYFYYMFLVFITSPKEEERNKRQTPGQTPNNLHNVTFFCLKPMVWKFRKTLVFLNILHTKPKAATKCWIPIFAYSHSNHYTYFKKFNKQERRIE